MDDSHDEYITIKTQLCKSTAKATTQSASHKSNEDNGPNQGYRSGNGGWEHLAGPGCSHFEGYSGSRITAEEMTGCTTVQWLVYKTPTWEPDVNDQIFELRSQYFLTGLSTRMPSGDDVESPFVPVRHGADALDPNTVTFGDVSHTWAKRSLFDVLGNVAADFKSFFAAASR